MGFELMCDTTNHPLGMRQKSLSPYEKTGSIELTCGSSMPAAPSVSEPLSVS